jgi:hypothetical protein
MLSLLPVGVKIIIDDASEDEDSLKPPPLWKAAIPGNPPVKGWMGVCPKQVEAAFSKRRPGWYRSIYYLLKKGAVCNESMTKQWI